MCRWNKRGRQIDAHRILNDLLVNFRRIVHRGLVTYSGELWYREGLPSDVFRRLVVRKENETPLDRFSGDYEELMTYANFRDLADIIVGNDVLSDRLSVLRPGSGVSLLDRLRELEEIKRSIASNHSASDEEKEKLSRYFDEFRAALKRKKSAPTETKPVPPSEPVEQVSVETGEETLDSIFDEVEPAPKSPKPRPGRLVVKVSAGGLRKASSEDEDSTAPASSEVAPPAGTDNFGSMETPVTDVATLPGPVDDTKRGPVEEAEGIELALREEDAGVILKALHAEVTEIADGMLRRDPKHGHVVWGQVEKRGWFEAHREEFELEPLEEFYGLADRFLETFSSGAKSSELKAILAEEGFSKLLLKLREMFLTSRAKV